MREILTKLWRDEEGASAVEYALVVAAIAAVIVLTVMGLGTEVNTTLDSAAQGIQDARTNTGT